MSSRIKGLFTSKKKKDEKASSKQLFSSASQGSGLSLTSKSRAESIGSFASSTSAFELQRDGASFQGESSVNLAPTPSSTGLVQDSMSIHHQQKEHPQEEQQQHLVATTSTMNQTSRTEPSFIKESAMTTDLVVEGLDIATNKNLKPDAAVSPYMTMSEQAPTTIPDTNDSTSLLPEQDKLGNSLYQSHLPVNVDSVRNQPMVNYGRSEQNVHEISQYSQRQDGSFVEQRSYISTSLVEPEQNPNEGVYLNSTTEFFPIDDQDEQVYLDQYSEDVDEFPVLQLKVSKLQKQVREMRKFMRGLVQLQIEQYEPATILIQAWWRGCLVRRELRKQRVFSWHRNPRRKVIKIQYLTRTELHQSCERISAPRASLLVRPELGADKETIAAVKLQAFFRSCLVRKRVQAYRNGMQAATIIQTRWRGYRTRNLDTRLGVEWLRFRNIKIQKAFGRVSIKLQYLQGRILALEENSLPMHEAQEIIHKEIEDMADQIDGLKQDLDQGLKQLDEQVSEEREQTTIEIRGLTERIKKLEDELSSIRSSNSSIEKQVRSLTLELPAGSHLELDKSDQDGEDDDDYEVQYDEDGNRIERPPVVKRASIQSQHHDQTVGLGARRTSNTRPIMDTTAVSSPTQMIESPIPMHQPLHRGSVGSIHSQGHTRTPSLLSQPPSSPGNQAFPRAFPASYSPTIANASALPEGGAFSGGARPHSIPYPGANNNTNNPSRPLTMDPNQLFRFHGNQYIPISPSTSGGPAFPGGGGATDTKKYVSMDDFEYMQAEVDTLRLNNDRLEGMVRELTMRLNSLTANNGQFYPG
ncbi:hypothetical protein BGZ51_001781 [Haplosporangium sp. Z 767]|nr:hypothetical protein BGZ51_001781 [Haplosporangium sp. Z 767]KAF9188093.1 hypothetical protein BGZ50_001531 [Haplosporangium sp. Z 11]